MATPPAAGPRMWTRDCCLADWLRSWGTQKIHAKVFILQ